MTYVNAMMMAVAAFLLLGGEFLMTPARAAEVATTSGKTAYVAPSAAAGLNAKNQDYLIGVLSFAFVTVAAVMAVSSMVNINYDDDTLLMVEVPEDIQHDE